MQARGGEGGKGHDGPCDPSYSDSTEPVDLTGIRRTVDHTATVKVERLTTELLGKYDDLQVRLDPLGNPL
jgi:hypothetical protein